MYTYDRRGCLRAISRLRKVLNGVGIGTVCCLRLAAPLRWSVRFELSLGGRIIRKRLCLGNCIEELGVNLSERGENTGYIGYLT
jgi:hypothetical protein